MTTTLTIDATTIGQTIGSTDGAIISLRMMAPPVYETPSWDAGLMCWKAGYFVLRGTGDVRDTVSVSPQTNGSALAMGGILTNGNIAYSGDLTVVAAPKGSSWSITLS